MSNKKKVRILPEGPYEVTSDVPLNQMTIEPDGQGKSRTWKEGKRYPESGEPYHLCRCGHSKNKPFCDGTHGEIGFEGKEVADKTPYDKACKVYEGDTIDLMDREEWCAVARFCDHGESVWGYAMASSVPGYEEEAIYEACSCPSGRLTIRRKDGEMIEPELPQEISVIQDPAIHRRGPLWVKGGITVEGADGEAYEVRNRVTLCRCGESRNMPFCDASHVRCDHMKGQDD